MRAWGPTPERRGREGGGTGTGEAEADALEGKSGAGNIYPMKTLDGTNPELNERTVPSGVGPVWVMPFWFCFSPREDADQSDHFLHLLGFLPPFPDSRFPVLKCGAGKSLI